MLVYIAAPWKHREIMPKIAEAFEADRHTITHKWWSVEEKGESAETAELLQKDAEKDVIGVLEAQVVVVVNTARSEGNSVEQGIAIGQNKPIIAIGTRGEHSKNVFHYLHNYIWVATIEEALYELGKIEERSRIIGRPFEQRHKRQRGED
jgi:nucleoside 2-deoxyribosyltransferase